MHHIRDGKHGARSTRQAIAIGLAMARRAGVKLPAPKHANPQIRRKAQQDLNHGQHGGSPNTSARRSRASLGALKREGTSAASGRALSRQARKSARRRGVANRSVAARKAAWTRSMNGGRS
jgi:hypothetical protein